ncbi:hypothetical protein Tco_0977042 [Tanacetum coccineum]|uniref:Uncharacterized protein n=1 Tax=Tanacetum coccineum TaxID=301880 RepID=A0ABQ5EIZ9_9ASTR
MLYNLFIDHSFGSDATITKLAFDQILFLTSGGAFGADDMGQKLEKEISIKQSCVLSFLSFCPISSVPNAPPEVRNKIWSKDNLVTVASEPKECSRKRLHDINNKTKIQESQQQNQIKEEPKPIKI